MTDQTMSRRDWFRLRKPQATPSFESTSETPQHLTTTLESLKPTMTPVPQPPNHDGMDLSQLPPLSEAELSREQVADLFADISQFGFQISLMHQGLDPSPTNQPAPQIQHQLRQILQSLIAGDIARVQLRYQWDDQHWIDTLQSQAGTFRLVRISHSNRPSSQRS